MKQYLCAEVNELMDRYAMVGLAQVAQQRAIAHQFSYDVDGLLQ